MAGGEGVEDLPGAAAAHVVGQARAQDDGAETDPNAPEWIDAWLASRVPPFGGGPRRSPAEAAAAAGWQTVLSVVSAD